jgi:hypothetical protein
LTKKNNRRTDQLIVAGGCLPIQNLVFEEHVSYNPTDAAENNTGYNRFSPWARASGNIDVTLRGCVWVGAPKTDYETLDINGWHRVEMTGNTIVGPLTTSSLGVTNFSENQYSTPSLPQALTSTAQWWTRCRQSYM